jgi:Domain of unknown function (DUF1772)
MNEFWATSMLMSGGLFTGGVVTIAWERIPAWRASELLAFRNAFAHTLRRMDRLQPALVVTSLVSTIGFAIGAHGMGRVFGILAATAFLLILAGSGAWLVRIQKRLVASQGEEPAPKLERLKRQWLRGHLIRTALAVAALALAALAALA